MRRLLGVLFLLAGLALVGGGGWRVWWGWDLQQTGMRAKAEVMAPEPAPLGLLWPRYRLRDTQGAEHLIRGELPLPELNDAVGRVLTMLYPQGQPDRAVPADQGTLLLPPLVAVVMGLVLLGLVPPLLRRRRSLPVVGATSGAWTGPPPKTPAPAQPSSPAWRDAPKPPKRPNVVQKGEP